MKRSVKFLLYAILLFLAATLVWGCSSENENLNYPVEIMLAESENLIVNGENKITVSAGETAEFDVTVPEGMKISSISDGAYYSDGKIRLDSVYYPATIKTVVREYYNCTYSTVATKGGRVQSGEKITVREDTEVTVQAAANDNYTFVGWSDGRSLENGGNIISTDRIYTFNITSDMKLYANFIGKSYTVVRYEVNGGTLADSDGEAYVDMIKDDYHFYANSLPDMGYFERDGYVLYGYNTEADGSGDYFGLGWNIVSDEKIITLYCMWAKETSEDDFEYEVHGKEAAITKYTGNADTVVVPSRIKGKKVTSIEGEAFTKTKASTVILPSTLEEIEERAFLNCKLQTLYLPDSVTDICDESFINCLDFSTLYVNSTRLPTYQTWNHGTYAIKYERMLYADAHGLKKLVFTSGSNGTYGVDSEQLEAGLDNEYYIIDYACHFQSCGMFFIDLISDFLNEDDIMLFMPEPNDYQMGSYEWTAVMWQFFEGAYGCITHVDIRDYSLVFESFREFNESRRWMSDTSYTDYWDGINRYGDNSWYRSGQYDGFVGSQGTYSLKTDHIDADLMNYVIDKCLAKGAKAYMTFPSLNEHALTGSGKKKSGREDYENYIEENLHTTLISTIEDYIFNGKYMADTNYHLSTKGTEIRTSRLISDLRAQLKKDYPGMWS